MACLLQPECNFLYGFFRCKLPVEVVDVEVKITSMQGTQPATSNPQTYCSTSAPTRGPTKT